MEYCSLRGRPHIIGSGTSLVVPYQIFYSPGARRGSGGAEPDEASMVATVVPPASSIPSVQLCERERELTRSRNTTLAERDHGTDGALTDRSYSAKLPACDFASTPFRDECESAGAGLGPTGLDWTASAWTSAGDTGWTHTERRRRRYPRGTGTGSGLALAVLCVCVPCCLPAWAA